MSNSRQTTEEAREQLIGSPRNGRVDDGFAKLLIRHDAHELGLEGLIQP